MYELIIGSTLFEAYFNDHDDFILQFRSVIGDIHADWIIDTSKIDKLKKAC
jgi:hypothetical protein